MNKSYVECSERAICKKGHKIFTVQLRTFLVIINSITFQSCSYLKLTLPFMQKLANSKLFPRQKICVN